MSDNRRQRSAQCATCGGPLRYYPPPPGDAEAVEPETTGAWAHLRQGDWQSTPHAPEPVE